MIILSYPHDEYYGILCFYLLQTSDKLVSKTNMDNLKNNCIWISVKLTKIN
jgi:hypothetical protein